jgi:radical SAM enzyme (TIGR01210 family)
MSMYPAGDPDRDVFVLARREARPLHDPWRSQDVLVEDERTATGGMARVATVFLTGRECPWRCVMCDLWRATTPTDTPAGAIPAQIAAARQAVDSPDRPIAQFKLYNAGSFFDPRAVPPSDYMAIAEHLAGLDRVIVESHPALVGPRVDRLLDALRSASRPGSAPPQLEVAMGLETVHPDALAALHKQMTVDDFTEAAAALRRRGVDVRAFVLIAPPFVPRDQQDGWLLRTIDDAFSAGASVVSLIPTRSGNGAMDALAAEGAFVPPTLADIERSVELAHAHMWGRGGRIFVDVWDLARFAACRRCFDVRRERLTASNAMQHLLASIPCSACRFGLPG